VARLCEAVFLTPEGVAAQLKVSREIVCALIDRVEVAAHRVGLALRVAPHELKVFLAGR
jgi:excisionase family DNA binding protein